MVPILPLHLGGTDQRTMAAITVPLQSGKVGDQTGPNGIQMNVADKFLEIYLFLTHNRFEAVLEKLAMTGVPSIESDDIAGQQSAHEIGQRDITGSEKKVGVVG
jgi:hypothetical protein